MSLLSVVALFAGCSKPGSVSPELAAPITIVAEVTNAGSEASASAALPLVNERAKVSLATPRGSVAAPSPHALEQTYVLLSSDIKTRKEVVQQLGQIGSVESVEVLSRLFRREMREELRLEIMETVRDLDDATLLEPKLSFFAAALGSKHPSFVREVAINLLSEIDDPRIPGLLWSLRADPDSKIRASAAEALRGHN